MDIQGEIKNVIDYAQPLHKDPLKDMNKKKSIFKRGDLVFHPSTGWAEVTEVGRWTGNGSFFSYTRIVGERGNGGFPDEEISFTEYKMEKKGFSHEKPNDADVLLKKIQEKAAGIIDLDCIEFLCLVNVNDYILINSFLEKKNGVGVNKLYDNSHQEYIRYSPGVDRIIIVKCPVIKEGEFKIVNGE